ncbi:hypothetical protein PIROE2DRAFT_66914, partial [Piromyces sp. E2]
MNNLNKFNNDYNNYKKNLGAKSTSSLNSTLDQSNGPSVNQMIMSNINKYNNDYNNYRKELNPSITNVQNSNLDQNTNLSRNNNIIGSSNIGLSESPVVEPKFLNNKFINDYNNYKKELNSSVVTTQNSDYNNTNQLIYSNINKNNNNILSGASGMNLSENSITEMNYSSKVLNHKYTNESNNYRKESNPNMSFIFDQTPEQNN